MNYDRIKNIFTDLYEELCNTFDNFESDFNKATGREQISQETNFYSKQNDVISYFEKVTESKEAVESFIKKLAPLVRSRQRFDVSSSYHYLVAKETRNSNIEIGRNTAVNYAAFKRKLASTYQMTQKDIHALIKATN